MYAESCCGLKFALFCMTTRGHRVQHKLSKRSFDSCLGKGFPTSISTETEQCGHPTAIVFITTFQK